MSGVAYLDAAEVRRRLAMPDLIEAMERCLIAYSAGEVVQPVRMGITVPDGWIGVMPAVGDVAGVKVVTFYPGNADRGMHTHHALVMLFDAATGVPVAAMDGGVITEMRTAAVSAVATRLLAAEDAGVLAVLGSGVQARAHVEAIRTVREIVEVRIWSRNPAHASALADAVGGVASEVETAVRGADVVVTATPATEPLFDGAWLAPGAHVNAVGFNGPEARELDDVAMSHAVFVDSRAGAGSESGNIRRSGAAITAELGEALTDPNPSWRQRTTVFDSVGMAIEDVAAAALLLSNEARAHRHGLGDGGGGSPIAPR